MSRAARLSRLLPIVALAALMSSCGTPKIRSQIPTLICPAIGLVENTTTVTRFKEPGDYTEGNVLYSASISHLTSSCDRKGGGVQSDIAFDVSAVKGPVSGTDQLSLPYFVAVTTKGGGIIAKQVFNSVVDLSKGGRGAVREHIQQMLTDLKNEKDLHEYEILIGFQLTDDDMVYNLSH